MGGFLGIDITEKNRYSGAMWEFDGMTDVVIDSIAAAIENGLKEVLCGDSGYELIPYLDTVIVIAYSEDQSRDLS